MSILLAILAGAGVNVAAVTGVSLMGVSAASAAKVLSFGPTAVRVLRKLPMPKHTPEKAWTEMTQEEVDWRIVNDNW